MTWAHLTRDIDDVFAAHDRIADAEVRHFARTRKPRQAAPVMLPRASSRLGRIVCAVMHGNRMPRDIARAAGLDVTDVRHDLQIMRRQNRIRRTSNGWTL